MPSLRRFLPVLLAALAMTNAGCGSKSPERTPVGPQAPTAGGDGRASALSVAPTLGAAGTFAVLGGSAVTNIGPTLVNGDLGVSPGSAISGFPPGVVSGTTHSANATSLAAQTAAGNAYNALAGQACNIDLTGSDLGGLTLTPGTYCFATSAQMTGTLTLDGQGNAGAVWVFQTGSSLTTASGSRVAFINGGQPCGVFWQVGSSATFGTTTAFAGNVIALASVTLNTGASSSGAVLARTGAATLDSNVVSVVGSCGAGPQPSPTPIPVPTLPGGVSWVLLVVLLGSGAYVLSRR